LVLQDWYLRKSSLKKALLHHNKEISWTLF
jgi:hypothetical protein